MVKWTKEQARAIETEGSDVLVAAAAGSGKTAVLVERIIQKLTRQNNPVDIDSLLVVTFTNAAAQEMRNRVGLALEKALAEQPESNHLKKQLSLLQRASISTLHSFCLDVVKQYAYVLDIDPSFRIANDMEADLMKQDVIDDLFEEWYGQEGEAQSQFFAVVDRFSSDRSDVDVETLVLDLYTFAMQNPWPDAWLDNLAAMYDIPDQWQEEGLEWLNIIRQEVINECAAMKDEMSLALRLTEEVDGPHQYAETIEKDLEMLAEVEKRINVWEDLQAYMVQSKFATLSRKKADCSEDLKERVKKVRDSYKKRWTTMKDEWFSRNLAGHVADMKELAPVVKQLTELVKAFKARFSKKKQESAVVDFSDLEHYCLQILVAGETEDGHIQASSVAKQLQHQFSEVLVDEYQDTNLVQETILQLVSDQSGPGNMFMVGDVKQSIYRFRHAEPSLFLEKYKRFAGAEEPSERIDLAKNFRSRPQVLLGTNYIFRQIIDEKLGDMAYDQAAELIYGNHMYDDLPNPTPEPELIIIDREAPEEREPDPDGGDEDYLDLEKAQIEARAYAEKIKLWIGQKEQSPLQVVDKATGQQRDIQYRDIVILQRSMTWAPTIVDELKKQGIPVYAELSTGYFAAIEVKVLLNMLKVIDNPRQDIPLASVLRSPIVGLNEDALTQIRLADRRGTFYEALNAYIGQSSDVESVRRIKHFLTQLEHFRLTAREGALSELIWQIYRETGYYDFVGGMPGGRQRQANLRALYDRARSYESTAFRGLFRFLRFIERMEERGDDLGAARALSEQEDVVRIMTIHKSKGLEFPVVILGGMDKSFNMMDLRQRYLLHKDLGFASRYIDPVKRISYPTLYYHALKQEKKRELLAEEMRVLYVALTRAKEKLVMIGNVASFAKKQNKWAQMVEHGEWVLPAHYRIGATSYLDWVGPALARHDQNAVLRQDELNDAVLQDIRIDPSEWVVDVVHGSDYANLEEETVIGDDTLRTHITSWQPVAIDQTDEHTEVARRLDFQYTYKAAAVHRAKQSVTEIKRQREIRDEYSGDALVKPFQAPIIKRPNFMQQERTISAAERGTIMHTVMQHIPFKRQLADSEVAAFVEGLVHREILTSQQAETVDTEAIAAFFETDIAQLMLDAPNLHREIPFSLALPAKDVYADWQGDEAEKVLVQGVIDCAIPTDTGWILLDYKTDRIRGAVDEKAINMLKKRYDVQMNLYRQAIEQIWRQPVEDTYLYFFNLEGESPAAIKL
ncbi:helicase-exonuclease AddAB subunit AddA [Lentibacillus saliphilus]|uniref:helicase-exonuclease AddAB subunit AddA n=1 Tax=Lentibacillus saliphilus TaxID=2737028 RepID=UPI001C2F3534|nr:helicase-exonuclease AddAB subunit AddA [Lentibacillus saliphilus]